jgi:hypothetical protein
MSVRSVCFFTLLFIAILHSMCAVVSVVLPIFESIAPRCALPSLFYLCEVAEDGSVLAGVELEFPGDGVAVAPQRRFFWSVVWSACLDAYDQAVMQAIRFLQGLFGFNVRNYKL